MTIKKLKPRQFTVLRHMADGSGTLFSYAEERIGKRTVRAGGIGPEESESYLYTAPKNRHFMRLPRFHRIATHSTVASLERLGLIKRSTVLKIPLGYPWQLTSAGRRVYEEQAERYESHVEPTVKVVASKVGGVNSKKGGEDVTVSEGPD